MRWLYQESSEPPEASIPIPVDPGEDISWSDTMDDPYRWRELRGPTGAKEQDRKLRTPLPDFETPVPSLFTLFDAFELNSWDSTQTMSAASNDSIRVAAAGNGKGGGDKGKGGGPGKDTGKHKIERYGHFAWPLGMSMPYTMGGGPPLGGDGTPPVIIPDQFSVMYWQDFFRKRAPILAFERELIDTLPERLRIDWETPFQHDLSRRRIVISDYNVESDLPRDETVGTQWDVPFSRPVWPPGRVAVFIDSFVNLVTDEEIFLDKWDSPLMRALPPRPRQPLHPWPFRSVEDEPLEEVITLDKWYTRLSHPVWPPPPLRLRIGELDVMSTPEEDLLPTRIPWWTPLSYNFHRRRFSVVPPIEYFQNLQEEEEVAPFIDKWGARPIDMAPWRPKMPVAMFPFRKEPEDTAPEEITLDKWYSPFSQNFRRLPPSPLPRFHVRPIEQDVETITLDKWYSNTGFWGWPHYALRHATGAEAQRSDIVSNTAPWIPMSRLDPQPVPDIPGVTAEWWFTPLALPVRMFSGRRVDRGQLQEEPGADQYLVLYYPLQTFPTESIVKLCDNIRRRVASKNTSCGV